MPERIFRERVRELMDQGAQLLDVLGRQAYQDAHLPRAINIPLRALTPDAVLKLDRDRPLVVYCQDSL